MKMIRTTSFLPAITVFCLTAIVLTLLYTEEPSPNISSPQEMLKQSEDLNKPDGFRRPYEAEGTSFVISNEIFPNLKVESTEPIKLIAETITNTVSFLVWPITTTRGAKTTLTVSGLNNGFNGLNGKTIIQT